jgi:prepilin-type N-terminal cleavage/methylation domain-containing protein
MSNKKGFTLIELLIVVVIIGILAAIAIPKFANTKDKAYVAAMKSDLRNMATYEEQYAADNNGASAGFQPVAERHGRDYEPSRPAALMERYRYALAVSEGLRHDQRRDHLRLS